MLTDDDIATRLRSGFDQVTADLHYTRRVAAPRPRVALVLAPAATLVGAAAVGAVALGQQQPAAGPAPRPITHAGPSSTVATPLGTPAPVARIRFAGYVMTYQVRAGADDAMARLVSPPAPVPAGARRVTNPEGVEGLIALYPGTHDQALWASLPKLTGSAQRVALVSQGLTAQQLADMWTHATPAG